MQFACVQTPGTRDPVLAPFTGPRHLRPSSSTFSGHCEAPRVFSQCLPRALGQAANRKTEAQAQWAARVRVKQGTPPVALPNPSQAPDSALMVVHALPNIPRPGARSGWAGASDTWGQGLAWNSNAGWRQGQVAAGVGDSRGGGRKKARELPHWILGCGKTRAATAGRHWVCIRPPSWGRALEPSPARRARRVAEGRVARPEKETQAH